MTPTTNPESASGPISSAKRLASPFFCAMERNRRRRLHNLWRTSQRWTRSRKSSRWGSPFIMSLSDSLVHHGKPLPESLIILEYIEETWKNPPLFLHEDPYERSRVRFWADFFDQKMILNM
ncbi:Glutathione S-transferase U10 [Acorus gramineus]|uniref:Glutathione S-transferase n=1 Tax=Acorus gramineus TaxID=55184 RepID=A0AAV9A9P8_ACOGR|nr:Glutathione S-transferase U10 [Acorus gramineus]